MDLNIEGTGEVMGWSPPVGEILSPGFQAVLDAHTETYEYTPISVNQIRKFIDKLEEKGYCIAKYQPD